MTNEIEEPAKPFRRRGGIGAGRKSGAKRAVNVTVDGEILAAAKKQGLNLSAVLEGELRRLTREDRIERFQEENREAIEFHNRFIEEHGIWSEKYRSW